MRAIRLFAAVATFGTALGLQLASAPVASAAWLGQRGMVFVSGKTSPSGETDILAFTFRDGSAVLVQDYTPNNRKMNLSPTVSPEGGPNIAFVEKAPGSSLGNIYVMNRYPPGGGLPRPAPLTWDGQEDQPTFSPAGGKIAYVRNYGGALQIWRMNLSGDQQEAIRCCKVLGTRGGGRGPAVAGTEPAWSPNNEWIAYVTPGAPQIAVASVTGLVPVDSTVASFHVTSGGGMSPNWSPLGDRIAYVTPQGQLAVVRFAPTGLPQSPTILDTPPAGRRDANPAWSPDAFTYNGHSQGLILFNRGSTLWSIDPNAANPVPHQLAMKGFMAGSNPDWRPVCSNNKPMDGKEAVIRGTSGPELLCGGTAHSTIYGAGGNDRIFTGRGGATVYAGPGNVFVSGGPGNDTIIFTGPGCAVLLGNKGSNKIVDDAGCATITGGFGNNTIEAADGILGDARIDGGSGGSNTCYVDNPEGGGPPELDFVWGCQSVTINQQAVAPGQ